MASKHHGENGHQENDPKIAKIKPIDASQAHVNMGWNRGGSPYSRPYIEENLDQDAAILDEVLDASKCIVAMYAEGLIADEEESDFADGFLYGFLQDYRSSYTEPLTVRQILEPTFARAENVSHLARRLFSHNMDEYEEKRAVVLEYYKDAAFDSADDTEPNDNNRLELAVLLGEDTELPIAFSTDTGTSHNPPSLKKALARVAYLNLRPAVVVTDRTMESEAMLASMLRGKTPIIGQVDLDYPWVKEALEEHFAQLHNMFTFIEGEDGSSIHAVTVPITLNLDELSGSEAVKTKRGGKGNIRRVFLHLYYDEIENLAFRADVAERVKNAAGMLDLEEDPQKTLSEMEWAKDLITIKESHAPGEPRVWIHSDPCEAFCSYAGVSALLSSSEEDAEEALSLFNTWDRVGELMDANYVSMDSAFGNKFVHFTALSFWLPASQDMFDDDDYAMAYACLFGDVLAEPGEYDYDAEPGEYDCDYEDE